MQNNVKQLKQSVHDILIIVSHVQFESLQTSKLLEYSVGPVAFL
jgi:hypothetical protein